MAKNLDKKIQELKLRLDAVRIFRMEPVCAAQEADAGISGRLAVGERLVFTGGDKRFAALFDRYADASDGLTDR